MDQKAPFDGQPITSGLAQSSDMIGVGRHVSWRVRAIPPPAVDEKPRLRAALLLL
jgi:hypothetical protein